MRYFKFICLAAMLVCYSCGNPNGVLLEQYQAQPTGIETDSENIPSETNLQGAETKDHTSPAAPQNLYNTPLKPPPKVQPAIMLPSQLSWYALEATVSTPIWSNQTNNEKASRDDNLLTAYTCTPTSKSSCAISLDFDKPATICALRIFATDAHTGKTARKQGFLKGVRIKVDTGYG